MRQENYRVIKLYSVVNSEISIKRPTLVDKILSLFDEHWGVLPKEYDIYGPYGIRKGSSVGIKSFKNKLEQKGHEKYHGLVGYTEDVFGFNLSIDIPRDDFRYSELILWFREDDFDVKFLKVVKPLLEVMKVTCGFEIVLPVNYNVLSETKVKKGLLGGQTVKISQEHMKWLAYSMSGKIRGVYKHNIFNAQQVEVVSSSGLTGFIPMDQGLSYMGWEDEVEYQFAKSSYEALH
jgi:hypothetical protein